MRLEHSRRPVTPSNELPKSGDEAILTKKNARKRDISKLPQSALEDVPTPPPIPAEAQKNADESEAARITRKIAKGDFNIEKKSNTALTAKTLLSEIKKNFENDQRKANEDALLEAAIGPHHIHEGDTVSLKSTTDGSTRELVVEDPNATFRGKPALRLKNEDKGRTVYKTHSALEANPDDLELVEKVNEELGNFKSLAKADTEETTTYVDTEIPTVKVDATLKTDAKDFSAQEQAFFEEGDKMGATEENAAIESEAQAEQSELATTWQNLTALKKDISNIKVKTAWWKPALRPKFDGMTDGAFNWSEKGLLLTNADQLMQALADAGMDDEWEAVESYVRKELDYSKQLADTLSNNQTVTRSLRGKNAIQAGRASADQSQRRGPGFRA